MTTTIATIILAAGRASRMSGPQHKLLLPLGNHPLLGHVIEAAIRSQAQPIIVILGHQAHQIRQHLSQYSSHPKVILQENLDYTQGMSTSLREGIRTLQEQYVQVVQGAIILPGDQPFITSSILDALIARKQETGKRIIAPIYHGQRGNPVLFDCSLFAELMQIAGDEGGRRLLQRHHQEVATIDIQDVLANQDIDTQEAYQQAIIQWKRRQEANEKNP